MATAGLIIGILAIFGGMIGCIPFLGWANWVNIPFGSIGIILSGIDLSQKNEKTKNIATAGLILSSIAVVFGIIRLMSCGGFI